MAATNQTLFEFSTKADISNWYIVNDGVMGGLSQSSFSLNKDGHGCFKGTISLDNNGGFASIRFDAVDVAINNHTFIVLKIKGDGKKYQIRIKENSRDFASYVQFMETTGDWQTIKIPLKDFYPSFRGRMLNEPNFSADNFQEFGILYGNKQEERFELLLDNILLE